MKHVNLKLKEDYLQSLLLSCFFALLLPSFLLAEQVYVVSDITKVPSRLEKSLSSSQLLKLLEKGDSAQRTRAAFFLGEKNVGTVLVYKRLAMVARNDSSRWVRRAAVKSMHKLFGRKAKKEILRATNDSDRWVAHSARNALNRIALR